MGTLDVFSDPASVAVVGASADPAKWGYHLARGALRGTGRRRVDLVNARGAVVEGVTCARSLAELVDAPELVVLTTPAPYVAGVVAEALATGTRGFLGITSGLDAVEPGLEKRVARAVREAGARMIGPNCLGLYDAATELDLTWGTFSPGPVAIISQSGQVGLELAGLARHAGLGVSRFVSIGNQADVTAAELLADLATHDATRAVIVYLEGFADGRALVESLAALDAAGKPAVLLTIGASAASRAAAQSHTGAMTSAGDVVAAACRAAGAVLVDTPAQALDVAHLLISGVRPRGRRVGIISDSGGQGAIAADLLTSLGMTVPTLSETARARVAAELPAGASTANPIDLAGAGEQDLTSYARTVAAVAATGEVDAVILSGYFGCYADDAPTLTDRELEVADLLAAVTDASALVHSMSLDSPTVHRLRERGVPTLSTIDAVAFALARVTDRGPRELRPVALEVRGEPEVLDYLAARAVMVEAGIGYPRAVAVRSDSEVYDATRPGSPDALTGPFVLKAGWLAHKTEVGGVAVGLPDAEAAASALADMRSRLGDGQYVLEEMDRAAGAVELIIGARRDPAFGPIVMVGVGGIYAELYRDSALALAPVDEAEAERMIRSLKAAPRLEGWRGAPAVDIAAAARAAAALSALIASDGSIAEAEINPLRVGPAGAVAVDAMITRVVPSSKAAAVGATAQPAPVPSHGNHPTSPARQGAPA